MKQNAHYLNGKWYRGAMTVAAALATFGVACADVIVRAEVRGSGEYSGRTGTYEIDYGGNRVRVVSPDGTVRLIDLGSLRAVRLDSKSKSYVVEPIFESSDDESHARTALGVGLDSASGAKTIGGMAAYRTTFSSTSGTPWTGDGWVADMSTWQSRPSSIAPILSIALPGEVGRDLASRYDQAGAFPLLLTLSNGKKGAEAGAIALTITGMREGDVISSSYQIPSGYSEAKANNQKSASGETS